MSALTTFGASALKVIGSLAPTVATALGGPFAGTAVSALETALGVTGKDNVEKAVLAGNPDALAKVQVAEDSLKATLASLKIEAEQLQYADVDSARKREEVLKDWTPTVLATAITIGFFSLLAALMAITIPARNEPVAYALVGALGAGFNQILSYYFGSSKGSADKTQSLIDAAQKIAK